MNSNRLDKHLSKHYPYDKKERLLHFLQGKFVEFSKEIHFSQFLLQSIHNVELYFRAIQ